MARVARSLRRAYEDGRDAEARADMSLASLFGGMALANAGLGAVHGLAAPIGGMFRAPHGAVCASLLPGVMTANLRALRAGHGGGGTLRRMTEVGRLLTGRAGADGDDAIRWIEETAASCAVPRLSGFGVTEADLPAIAGAAQQSSSMKGNPVALSSDELVAILTAAL
jgi:alcohol dehydrogenase class IV